MIILYDNKINNSTITSSTENPNFTWASAFNDTVLAHAGRSIGISSQWILFTFTSAISATHFMIFNHNFEATATVRIQANSVDSWASPPINIILTLDSVIYESFASASYKYWRISMSDSTSSQTYFKIGKVFLGIPYSIPDSNAGWDIPEIGEPRYSKSKGGQIYGQGSTFLQVYNINLQGLSLAEKNDYKIFADAVNYNNPFALVPFEDTPTDESILYCNLANRGAKAFQSEYGKGWNIPGIVFEECK